MRAAIVAVATVVAALVAVQIWIPRSMAPPRGPLAATAPEGDAVGAATPTAQLVDMEGLPTRIIVEQGDNQLVDAEISLIQLDKKGWLAPPPGVAGWYGPPQWETRPGDLSPYRGIVVGHNVHRGQPDVFYKLGEVRGGALIRMTFELDGLEEEATFRVLADAVSAPKDVVTGEADDTYSWVWQSDRPERMITLISCDLDAPHDPDGHSLNNWIVQAERVS
ncbi:MAG: class F sortase [Mycobacterium sp.]